MANYLPFNSINADRAVKAEDWAWYFSTFIGNGVFPKPTNGLQVLADNGMDIVIKAGYGFVNGYAFRNPSDYTVTVANADGSHGRIDRVVLRWSLTDRLMELDLKQGTVSAEPIAPALVRTADTYELALADIAIPAGTTTITQANITDRRTNTDLCGIVEGTVSQIDWSTLTLQLDAFMEEYSVRIVTFEENFETTADNWFSSEQEIFAAWVATLHDILDSETAGHLQNEISEIQARHLVEDSMKPWGYLEKSTTFAANGSIVETDTNGTTTTVFNADGTITETWENEEGDVTRVKTTTFNNDGSISEIVTDNSSEGE